MKITSRDHLHTVCIYLITNKINGKIYVGRTKSLYRRYYQYKSGFKFEKLKYINGYLLSSMKKYGFENFEFSILQECSLSECEDLELYWIEKLKSNDKNIGYNLRIDVGGKLVVDKRTSEKISKRLKKEWSNGSRAGHANKLKQSWENRSREDQGKLFSKILTKYKYRIIDSSGKRYDICYKDLKAFGFASVISNFHRQKSNVTTYKGMIVERISV